MKQFVYRVDAGDRIQFMDANWRAFAWENGADSLTEALVKGSSLWDHILDATTRNLYRVMMTRVRETGRPATMPFRCDSPERRRFMALEILRQPEMGLEFRSHLLREEPTSRVALLDATIPRSTELLRMCCWCKKVEAKAAGWQEPEAAVRLLNLFEAPALPLITHVTCPFCETAVLQELDQL